MKTVGLFAFCFSATSFVYCACDDSWVEALCWLGASVAWYVALCVMYERTDGKRVIMREEK